MSLPRVRMTPALAGLAAGVAALLFAAWFAGDDEAPTPRAGAGPVDPYAPHEPEDTCDPTPKPGALMLRSWAISRWGERPGSPQNISRDCSIGGSSGHKEGRAWDLMVTSRDHGQAIVDAMLAPDPRTGEPHALARRAGVMYLIWNEQIWRAYPWQGQPSGTWSPYSGESAHTDHVHFSLSWAGARGETSLYDDIRKQFPAS